MRDLEQYAHYFFSSPDEEPSVPPLQSSSAKADRPFIILVHSSVERYAALDIVTACADALADGESRMVVVTSNVEKDGALTTQGMPRQPRHAHVTSVSVPEWMIMRQISAGVFEGEGVAETKAATIAVVDANAFTPDCLDVLSSLADCEMAIASDDVSSLIEAYQFVKAYTFPKQGCAEFFIVYAETDGRARLMKESIGNLFSAGGYARCSTAIMPVGNVLKGESISGQRQLQELRSQGNSGNSQTENTAKKIFMHFINHAAQVTEMQRR